ncbi:MAG TPA: cell division protein FtsZ [Sumerlaeia bacterium]|nr:cell division protein FtsZ [Sumerlaeia bacterium]
MDEIEFVEDTAPLTRIKVIGVGGGGSNAVDSMIDMGLTGVDFCNINTDLQALQLSKSPNKLHIGREITHGMGCGGDPAQGEKAALASKEQITQALGDCDMVFIATGLGGGTGTGAAPVVAEIAKSLGLLTVAIVTKPFAFEGPQRHRRAEQGLAKLSEFVDTKIVILNDKLTETVGPKTPLTEAFDLVNRVLAQGVHAISDLISVPGEINVDFMDVKTVMGETGGAVMGVGIGKGENRATEAVKKACASPLQEKIVIEGARGVLISITSSPDVSLQEINAATSAVYEVADPEANIIFGMVIDPSLKDEMRVTIIATGFPDEDDRFPAKHPRDEELSSPKTDLDLETKLRSMMSADEPSEPEEDLPAEIVSAPEPQVAPQTASPRPPAAGHQAAPPKTESQLPFDFPSSSGRTREATGPARPATGAQPQQAVAVSQASPSTATSARPAAPPAPTPDERKKSEHPTTDLNTPAYLRRRKTLFE